MYRGVARGTKVREVLGKHTIVQSRHLRLNSHTEVGGGCLSIPVMLLVICHMRGCSMLCFDCTVTIYRALEILMGHLWI